MPRALLFLLGAALMAAILRIDTRCERPALAVRRDRSPHGAERGEHHGRDRAGSCGTGRSIRPLLILALWDFGPALGTPLQYHMANDLHATDTEVGAFYALYFSCYVPTLLLYGWLCQRMSL